MLPCWVDPEQSATSNATDWWIVIASISLSGMILLGLTVKNNSSLRLSTPLPTLYFDHRGLRRSLDEITEANNRSIVSGYIKMILQHKKQSQYWLEM